MSHRPRFHIHITVSDFKTEKVLRSVSTHYWYGSALSLIQVMCELVKRHFTGLDLDGS